ncbi:MAG: hypothetical protein ACE37J_13785 [Pikeienuella sp.]|uniref:hypothetical protein n=1 Tax=Pikeienuella sp. TaxID=2831957 RepID=UPI00391BCFC1
MTRADILRDALAARIAEVEGYQINIDNYALALAHIDAMAEADRAELAGFREELAQRLAAERHQQKRAAVMLAVIRQQVEAP